MAHKGVTFVYDAVCPFAQRSWITLLEKQVPFQKMKIDLKNKSQEFKDLYVKALGRDPTSDGKVPLLLHDQKILSESDLISWYLSQGWQSGTQLLPKDPFELYKMRLFIQNVIPKFISAFYSVHLYQAKPEEEQQKIKSNILNTLQLIDQNIKGPYVLGEEVSLADVLLYPWFERWCVHQTVFGIDIPADLQKVLLFKATFEKRPSVLETKKETSDQFFIDMYTPYFQGTK